MRVRVRVDIRVRLGLWLWLGLGFELGLGLRGGTYFHTHMIHASQDIVRHEGGRDLVENERVVKRSHMPQTHTSISVQFTPPPTKVGPPMPRCAYAYAYAYATL